MGKYNTTPTPKPPVKSHEGGESFKLNDKHELVSILATGLDNKFYEQESDREKRLKDVINRLSKKEPEFVAKALIYARSIMGQRSVTHFGSVSLLPALSGNELGKRFFSKRDKNSKTGGIIYRLDDMLEITACYQAKNPGKPLPNCVRKGFKDALENADKFELARYQARKNAISLHDIVNLVHPNPKPEMREVFKSLMNGTLKQFNTVEDKNTKSGIEISNKVKSGEITKQQAEVELNEAKEENYAQLIKDRKIGYLALLRNLRNILKTTNNKHLINDACNLLVDEKLIKKSLVFPHQIDLALEIMLTEFQVSQMREFSVALNKAYELAIPNLTELFTSGRTAVIFDSSGSMSTKVRLSQKQQGSESAIDKAALIAATLAKGIGADVYHFADSCNSINFNINDSVNTIKKQFLSKQGSVGYGTNFTSIFYAIQNKYDRIFVISDMQGADSLKRNIYNNMYIYSVDICGYGTTMFKPGDKIIPIYGYSAEIYESIKKAELNYNSVIKEIESITI
jgi:60 kDa SS-A/Ro ribonucleoprotein